MQLLQAQEQVYLDRARRMLGNLQEAIFGVRSTHASLHGLDDDPPRVAASLVAFGLLATSLTIPSLPKHYRNLVTLEARTGSGQGQQANHQSTSQPSPSASPSRYQQTPLYAGSMDTGHRTWYSSPTMRQLASTQKLPTGPMYMATPASSGLPSVEELHRGNAFGFKDLNSFREMVEQHLGRRPSLKLGSQPMNTAPALLYHQEMKFIASLVDVSHRLLAVPKEGRGTALQAELTLLNLNLPANLCLPIWCPGQTRIDGGQHVEQEGHHRILRLVEQEAVVLSSAERTPFLLYLEVVEGMEDEEFSTILAQARGQKPVEPLRLSSIEEAEEAEVDSPSKRRPRSRSLNEIKGKEKKLVEEDRRFSPPVKPTNTHQQQQQPTPLLQSLATTPKSPRAFPSSSVGLSPLQQPVDPDAFAQRMRTAAIMLSQLTREASLPTTSAARIAALGAIRARIIGEMEALEKSRLLDALQAGQTIDLDAGEPEHALSQAKAEDPSAAIFRESWAAKEARLQAVSPFGHLKGWALRSVIVKADAEMRQEQLACQIIAEMDSIWRAAGLPLWTYPYQVLVAGPAGGLVETVRNAVSLHSVKRKAMETAEGLAQANGTPVDLTFSLRDHFIRAHGSPDSQGFLEARAAFGASLAAYSLITYVLQLRDRHNGNILLDSAGHLIHIDFGFMLSNAPGKYYGFESAPFKLVPEYIDLLGGLTAPPFLHFKELLFQGFMALRRQHERILLLVEIMQRGNSRLPCFEAGEACAQALRQRLQLGLTEPQVRQFVERMVTSSAYNVFTKLYDSYQYYTNGIL